MDGTFTLAYLVFNTIMNLTTQDAQVACFQNVAAHLEPGGCFVIEVRVPAAATAPARRDDPAVQRQSPTRLGLRRVRHRQPGPDLAPLRRRDGTFGPRSIPFRYVWPSELDLMARLAGMRLRERWGGWRREPFTSESDKLVGVWEKAG